MIRKIMFSAAALGAVFVASASPAKQYVDYTPGKGVWEINAIEVDPNHIDEYLIGLRRTQTPVFEVLKKHGVIDSYRYIVRTGYSKGAPNVLIESHYTSAAMLEADKVRDQAIDKEIDALMSEADGKAAVAGYEKYRQFIDDGIWTEMTLAK